MTLAIGKAPIDDWVEPPALHELLEEVRAAADAANAGYNDKLRAAVTHIAAGRVAYAQTTLETLATYPPAAQYFFLRYCQRVIRGHARLSLADPATHSVMAAPRDGAKKIVLQFAGIGARYAVPHRAVMGRQDVNHISLRDAGECGYLNGVRGLGDDFRACCARLSQLAAALSADAGLANGDTLPIYCMGLSSGAYAALRYGVELGARSVLFFSGATTLRGAHASLKPGHPLGEFARAAPEVATDLRELYAAAPNPPKLIICYGQLNQHDARLARRMEGLRGVEFAPLPGCDSHVSLFEAIQLGQFDRLAERWLAA